MPSQLNFGRTVFCITICVLLSSCGGTNAPEQQNKAVEPAPTVVAQPQAEPMPANLPVWQPDPKFVPVLNEKINSVQFPPKFTMQMLHGYELAPREEAWRKEYMLFGPERKDKTHVAFMINVLNGKMGGAKTAPSLGEATTAFTNAIKSGRSGRWKAEPVEDGNINGVHFQRVRWEGEEPTSKELMKGFIYVCKVGDEIFEFTAQDMAKYEKEGLKQLDSAVRTVKMVR